MIIPRPFFLFFSLCFLVHGSVGQHWLSALFHGELLAGTYGSDCFATQFSGVLAPGLILFGGEEIGRAHV